MAISNTGIIGREDLLATASDITLSVVQGRVSVPSRGIICTFSFQTVRMPDVVLVLLVELVVRQVAKRPSPECDSFVDR